MINSNSKPLAIFLMGPTASGKTALALELVKKFPMDVISVDSALIYCDMNIGSAKPDAATLEQAPHRLINIREPSQSYSAADFRIDALREMENITKAGRIPLLVGGTMLYFKVLQEGIAQMPKTDADVRVKVAAQLVEQGLPALHEKLTQIDPVAATRIHPNDTQRLLRALEVYELSGKSLTDWQQAGAERESFPYHVVALAIAPNDRAVLHQRIAARFHMMLDEGLIDEVKRLRTRGDLNVQMPSMRSVGYRQVWEYLEGSYDFSTMTERAIIATRQLAKRQLTWLRSWKDVDLLDSENPQLSQQVVEKLSSMIKEGS